MKWTMAITGDPETLGRHLSDTGCWREQVKWYGLSPYGLAASRVELQAEFASVLPEDRDQVTLPKAAASFLYDLPFRFFHNP